jgi:hypothetical protein
MEISSLSTLPPSRSPRASERQIVAASLKTAPRRSPLPSGNRKVPVNAVAPPRAAVPKVALRWSGNHPDPRTPSFGKCPVICQGTRASTTVRPRSSIVKCAPNSSCGVDPPMKAVSQAVVKQSERLAFGRLGRTSRSRATREGPTTSSGDTAVGRADAQRRPGLRGAGRKPRFHPSRVI